MSGFHFAGWLTRDNVLCTDGTTIRKGCFAHQDGEKVPLVWNHQHNDVNNVLGYAILHAVPGGMRGECYTNNTERGRNAREMIEHGELNSMSIYANHLKRRGGDIYHGTIREVSLVLAPADPTALIDTIVEHGDVSDDAAEIIYSDEEGLEIFHADEGGQMNNENVNPETDDQEDDAPTVQDIYNTLNDEQKKAVAIIVGAAVDRAKNGSSEVQHAEKATDDQKPEEKTDSSKDGGKTVGDVYNAMTPEQKKVVAFLVGMAVKNAKGGNSNNNNNNNNNTEGESEMKHNVFESDNEQQDAISHEDMTQILKNARKMGSLKAAFEDAEESGMIAHADYGVENVDYLFPDAKVVNTTPDFIKRDTSWVDEVMNGTHHTPFSRVKSIFADITADEARAKGYIKGKLKKEEVFSLLKRTTDPQTIYKKQKLDKDDIDDITDFNVVAWIKSEMQMMLREEIARAILIGDGRLASDDDKIKEDHIRPVYNDADLYTVKVPVNISAGATDDEKAKALIKAIIKARKNYKGSGNPTFFTTDDELTNCLLLENGIGERMYKSEAEVATAIRASKITPVEDMEGQKIAITEGSTTTS